MLLTAACFCIGIERALLTESSNERSQRTIHSIATYFFLSAAANWNTATGHAPAWAIYLHSLPRVTAPVGVCLSPSSAPASVLFSVGRFVCVAAADSSTACNDSLGKDLPGYSGSIWSICVVDVVVENQPRAFHTQFISLSTINVVRRANKQRFGACRV